jgi:hypothetical protein
MLRALALLLCWAATGALAQEVTKSPRPPANPLNAPAVAVAGTAAIAEPEATPEAAAAAAASPDAPRPKPRPAALATAVAAPAAEPEVQAEDAPAPAATTTTAPEGALASSLRPEPRPRALAERIAALTASAPAAGLDLSSNPGGKEVDLAAVEPPTAKERRKKKREAASMKGSVCGVPGIKGQEIQRITSKVKGCGVEEPVAVTSIAGVRLSQTATVDCSIAKALNSWVDEVAQPAFDGKLVEVQVAAHYICRGRNNKKGAKISEHGKGRAIDISAFILSNGKVLTVAGNYNKLLRGIYKAACPYFRTTLGPGSDGYHEDHFHFDTSARSGGSYCR